MLTFTFTTSLPPYDEARIVIHLDVEGLDDVDSGDVDSGDVAGADGTYWAYVGLTNRDEISFPRAVLTQRVLSRAIKTIGARLDKLKDDLLWQLTRAGLAEADPATDPAAKNPAVTMGRYQIRVTNPRNPSRIDRGRLVELGVDPEIIAKATIPGVYRSQVDIRPIPTRSTRGHRGG